MYTIKKLRKRGIDYYFKDEMARNLISSIKQKITEITNGGGSAKQVQSDWNESNATSSAYIRNKPLIPSLNDYYTKSETEGMLDGKQSALIAGTNITIEDNVISATGEVTINLSNYYTKTEIDNKGYLTQHQDISGKVDKEQGKGLSTNDYTTAEKTKLSDLPTNAQLSQQLSGKANSSDVYPKSLTYTKTEVDNAIGNAVEGLGTGSVKSIIINNITYTPDSEGNVDLEDIGGIQGQPGADGIAPHIDVVTGHWFIGDEDTGIDAHGPQGNSGYTGAVGELEVVNNLTDGGAVKALSAEQGKLMAIQSIPGAGSFADAYDKARANNVVFPWFLRDVDENGNPIEKMIWHNGYRKFVDAIGAEVVGQKNGLTIKVNADCDLLLGSTTYPLTKGVNNLPFDAEGINWDGTSVINTFDVRVSGTSTSAKNYVEEIDFGGLKVFGGAEVMKNWGSLKKVKRLYAEMGTNSVDQFCVMDNIETFQMTGEGAVYSNSRNLYRMRIFSNCPNLVRLDLNGFNVGFVNDATKAGLYSSFETCKKLEYADIRGIDTSNSRGLVDVFKEAESLKTLIIGNFSNGNASVSNGDAFKDVRDCVLICTTSEPPTLNTEYDWITTTETIGGVEQDVCHFSAIYVPTDAVNDYKAATGWSEYASIIHDIAEYNG